MKRFLAALRFLTVLPVPGRAGTARTDLAGSPSFFPVVGLLIGGAAAALALGLTHILPILPAAVLVALFLAAASGGLHLDGLSDTADGLLGARSRERALEIMRDSRAGPMGVAAVASVLGLKFAALGSLDPAGLWRAALLMPLAGRCALVVGLAAAPYAREEGLASAFHAGPRASQAPLSVLALALAGWLAAGNAGLAVALAATGAALLFTLWTRGRLGGTTGDTLGAGCELVEAVGALVLATWSFKGLGWASGASILLRALGGAA